MKIDLRIHRSDGMDKHPGLQAQPVSRTTVTMTLCHTFELASPLHVGPDDAALHTPAFWAAVGQRAQAMNELQDAVMARAAACALLPRKAPR